MAGQAPTTPTPAPRRLPQGERRRQLIAAALPLAARQGLAGLSLDDLAARAGVTRNLVYHYFPRGRPDVALAVVEEAERQLGLASEGETGHDAMIDHALAPTHAWRIHRMATADADHEIRAASRGATFGLVRSLAIKHLNTANPAPATDVALHGYVGFAADALDRGRASGAHRSELAQLLQEMLAAALDAAGR